MKGVNRVFYDLTSKLADLTEQYAKVGNLRELHEKLRSVPDSNPDFIGGIIRYAAMARSRKENVLTYINEHSGVKASDIIDFVTGQDDFRELDASV